MKSKLFKISLLLILTQASIAKSNTDYKPIVVPQPTTCISSAFSSSGDRYWKNMSLTLTNKCTTSVDFQNAAITFSSKNALNTNAWGTFDPLPYPDNNLQLSSQLQSRGNYLVTLNLHFPNYQGSSTVLPVNKSITVNYGASTDGHTGNANVYLNTPVSTGTITLVNVTAQPANVTQNYALVHITLNGQKVSDVQLPWNGTQNVANIAPGTYALAADSVTDSSNLTYQGSVTPATVVVVANQLVNATVAYTSVPVPPAGKVAIQLQALPSQLAGYTGQPTAMLTTTGGSSISQALKWGSTTTISSLMSGTLYALSTPGITFNGFQCAPTFAPSSVTASGTTTPTSSLTYNCIQTVQNNVTLNVTGAPSTLTTLNVTLTPNDGTASISQAISLNNGAGSGVFKLPNSVIYTVTSDSVSGYSITYSPQPLTSTSTAVETITLVENSSVGLVGPFTTKSGTIVDANQKTVSFSGVNWFGFNTDTHVVEGLDTVDFDGVVAQIKALGFNAVRIPIQFDFINNASIKPTGIATTCGGVKCNTDVPKTSAQQTLQWMVTQFTNNGLFVLIDDHYEDTTYETNYASWLTGWKNVATMFKSNPLVGYDIYNEPDQHSILWDTGSTSATAWSTALQAAATNIYSIDTQKLIFVEGTGQTDIESNYGNGFATDAATIYAKISNPKAYFTSIMSAAYLNQIVISPHIYGPDGTSGAGPDESNQTHAFGVWLRSFGYLNNNYSSPSTTGFCTSAGVCHQFAYAVGEFGGRFDTSDPAFTQDVATNVNIAAFINKLSGTNKGSWFYWDLNPDSTDTGGIFENDWKTVDCNKISFLKTNLGLKPNAGICGS